MENEHRISTYLYRCGSVNLESFIYICCATLPNQEKMIAH